MAGVIKEFICRDHGPFEGSHPICPSYGCLSEHVEREFRTAPAIGTGIVKRMDAGLSDTANRLGISNWRSARPGDSSFAGRASTEGGADKPLGTEVLWGDAHAQRVMGKGTQQMVGEASRVIAPRNIPASDPYTRVNNGVRAVANTTRVFERVLPHAEVQGVRGDPTKVSA